MEFGMVVGRRVKMVEFKTEFIKLGSFRIADGTPLQNVKPNKWGNAKRSEC